MDLHIEFGFVVGRAGNNQRRPRFIYQDRIDFIDNREVERALHHLRAFIFHIVAQIIETKFVVRRISDIASICVAAIIFGDVWNDNPCRKAKEPVNPAHPFRVTAGQIVVHGHNMNAFALKRVEIAWQCFGQGFTLTRAHFGDFATMQHNTADHLHIKMAHAHDAL